MSKFTKAAEVIENTSDMSKISRAVDTIQDVSNVGRIRPDFYVTSTGEAIPSTAYRYMASDASYITHLKIQWLYPKIQVEHIFPFPNGLHRTASWLEGKKLTYYI